MVLHWFLTHFNKEFSLTQLANLVPVGISCVRHSRVTEDRLPGVLKQKL